MKTNYFEDCKTLEDVKRRYYELVRKYHPDKPENGDTEQEILKAVNNKYEVAFQMYKNIHRSADGEAYTKETNETPEQFREVIRQIIHLDDINIEICGSWIWISGETKKYKLHLKMLKFKWSPKKSAWYWHTGEYRKWSKQELSLDEIRAKYGITKVDNDPVVKLNNNL